VITELVYSQDAPSSGQNKGPPIMKALGNGQGFELTGGHDDTAATRNEVPSRVRKAVMKQLNIDPKKISN
jgi:hypothetical protein